MARMPVEVRRTALIEAALRVAASRGLHETTTRAIVAEAAPATLAGLTGEPLAKVLGIVGEARAISREEKAVWRKLAATAVLLAVGMLGTLPAPSQAAYGHENSAQTMHYAKLW